MLSRSLFWSVWVVVLPIVVPDKQGVGECLWTSVVASVKLIYLLLGFPGSMNS